MPLTFPSHAAAVLPLLRGRWRGLPATALIVGTTTPDLAYVLSWPDGRFTHSLAGLVEFCLPVGLVMFLWTEWALMPTARSLPTVRGVELSRFGRAAVVPTTGRGWLLVLAALVIGALTHLLWDGFTHVYRWPASALYGGVEVELLGLKLRLPHLLQHISTIGGAALMGWHAKTLYPELPPAPRVGLFPWRALAIGFALGVAAWWWVPDPRDYGWIFGGAAHPQAQRQAWLLFWSVVRWELIALAVSAGAEVLQENK